MKFLKTEIKNGLIDGSRRNILIEGSKIAAVGEESFSADITYDASGKILFPGMIDLHVHVRDMLLSAKEDWSTCSEAALRGGVTTIFDMPNTKPATVDLDTYLYKYSFAKKSKVNYAFYMGASPGNEAAVRYAFEQDRTIPGLKIFMAGSSQNEVVDNPEQLKRFFEIAHEFDKPVLLHCETQCEIDAAIQRYNSPEYNSAAYHNLIRNPEAALSAVQTACRLAVETGAKIHILHISTLAEIECIRGYKQQGFTNITCETTPHHLFLSQKDVEQWGNYAKVNPPIRTLADNEAITEAVCDGSIDTIGSDHAPHTLEEKALPYFSAPSGFPGLETTVALLLHHLYLSNRISYNRLCDLIANNAVRILNIKERGKLLPGYFADIIIVDPETKTEVNPAMFSTKAKYSPYAGMVLNGVVINRFVNGLSENTKGMLIEYEQS